MGKKDEYRFTIRFDPDDDRHRLAAQILNSQGRKIARYVARAVLAYREEIPASDSEHEERPGGITKEERVKRDIKKENGSVPDNELEEEYEMDEEEIALLKNTNHMFRRK
ncbi:hypothetical protein QMP26_05725 [Enterocloster clostridioformis]|uniref:hypothetical protein n=1 Tax=Enterocloster clostridioformis TaxID=1531 RepID=UPI0026752AA7|nr:hypothetical protein [Enterocloster clostridioformis]